MLVEQIIEFQSRGPGPPGRTCTPRIRHHGGAFRGCAPQMTACSSQNENCAPPQARTVPRRN